MRRQTTTVAAVTALSVLAGSVSAADAQVLERDSVQYWKQTCAWQVDEKGKELRDEAGKMIPVLGPDGRQKCSTVPIEPAELPQSSGKPATTSSAPGRAEENNPNWDDAERSSSELSVGAVLGIVGAVIALIVGIGWVFVDDLNVRLVPAQRR